MKTRLLQLAAATLLLGITGLTHAAEQQIAPQPDVAATTTVQAAGDSDRLAWQRVGAPETLQG